MSDVFAANAAKEKRNPGQAPHLSSLSPESFHLKRRKSQARKSRASLPSSLFPFTRKFFISNAAKVKKQFRSASQSFSFPQNFFQNPHRFFELVFRNIQRREDAEFCFGGEDDDAFFQ